MPTILRIGPYRFFFYSNEGVEPPHIHVERDAAVAKIWLDPIALAEADGFRAKALNEVLGLVELHRTELLHAWNDYHG